MKKSQITVYIIIGITILLLVGSAIYLTQKLWRPAIRIEPVAQPIKDYVETCMQQVTEEALIPIGANGGYLDPMNPVLTGRYIETSPEPAEGDALLISLVSQQAIPYWFYMSTPNTCKDCRIDSLQPSLKEIENQIKEYVDEKLEECINSFEPFLEQGYIFTTGKPESEIMLTEKNTRVLLNYPVTINKLDIETKIQDFEAVVDIPFKKIYELADKITAKEEETAFLEAAVFHIISLHTGLSMSKMPPLAEITHGKTSLFWLKPLVAMNLQQLLLSYIPVMQIANTQNAKEIKKGDNAFEQGFYKGLYMELFEEKYPLEVDFAYLDWPIYFDITPRNRDMLTGETHIQEFPYNAAPPFQTNYYEFFYDISAPVLVEIRDPDAMKGKGYSFNFALELNLRDNKNFVEWNIGEGTVGIWDLKNMNTQYADTTRTAGNCIQIDEDEDLWKCDLTGKVYKKDINCVQSCVQTNTTTKDYEPLEKLFSDEEQRVSDTAAITVLDAVTNEPVPEASLLYKCGRYGTTIVGTTGYRGRIKQKLPMCINGQLSIDSDGYAKKAVALTIKPEQRKNITVYLEPEVEVKTTIKKYPIEIKNLRELDYSQEPDPQLSVSASEIQSWEDLGMAFVTGGIAEMFISPLTVSMEWDEEGYKVGRDQKNAKIYDRHCCNESESLKPKHKAILLIEKIPETPIEPTYFKTVMLEQGKKEDTITLIPGQYKVTGMLMDLEGFVIKPGCQETCLEYETLSTESVVKEFLDPLDALPPERPECKKWGFFPEDPIEVKPALRGGVTFDNDTGYWNVTRANLTKGAVEFYFIETLKPTCTMVHDCVLDVCVDIGEMMATKPYTEQYREYLEPKFMSQ